MKIKVKYSPSIKNINTILDSISQEYSIIKEKIRDNDIFEVYDGNNLVYTFSDDFNNNILTQDIVLEKIKNYLLNRTLRNSGFDTISNDNIDLDEY
tara:strand:+ start:97 stop:384 length:288 start_codon:yes stop_codon:yes gene_type:complete